MTAEDLDLLRCLEDLGIIGLVAKQDCIDFPYIRKQGCLSVSLPIRMYSPDLVGRPSPLLHITW